MILVLLSRLVFNSIVCYDKKKISAEVGRCAPVPSRDGVEPLWQEAGVGRGGEPQEGRQVKSSSGYHSMHLWVARNISYME